MGSRGWYWSLAILLTAVRPAAAHEHKPPAPVPATLEIEVLDPGVHPTGNPTVVPTPGPDGRVRVEIPPVVLVHRYYYTGDRTFQGPLLPGGPSIVVVTHPKSAERLYLPVQMLPGAPKVTYTHCSIVYDFGPQSIHLIFSHVGDPRVVYRQGTSVCEKAHHAVAHIGTGAKNLYQRTDLPQACDNTKSTVKNVAVNVVDKTNDLVKTVAMPVGAIVRTFPGVTTLTSDPGDRAVRARDAQIRRAESKAANADASIPTNR